MINFYTQKNLNPKKDWFLILSISFLCLIGLVLYNVYVFRAVLSDTFVSFSSEDVTVATLPKESLSRTVELIKDKEKSTSSVLSGEIDVPDPSN